MPNVYEIVTNQMIAKLEAGVIPWRRPWTSEAPMNLCSGRPYRGINTFLLGLCGYASPYWLTFRQAKERGGSIRKGEHATTVVFWKWMKAETETPDEETLSHAPVLRYYNVFNVEQCDNIVAPAGRPPVNPIASADAIVAGMPNPPKRMQADKAFYRPSTDTVAMPDMNCFHDAQGFYATLFHELTHSTGHALRLNRPGIMEKAAFGSDEYGKEELVAEMGTGMLCAIAGINNEQIVDNSAAYLANWLKAIKEDSRLVVLAAAQAQKAADHILGVKQIAEKDGE
jgi:antirestriction protein ArdC